MNDMRTIESPLVVTERRRRPGPLVVSWSGRLVVTLTIAWLAISCGPDGAPPPVPPEPLDDVTQQLDTMREEPDRATLERQSRDVVHQLVPHVEPAVRLDACAALDETRDPEASQLLGPRLDRELDSQVIGCVAHVLARVGYDGLEDLLKTMYRDAGPEQRVLLAEALLVLGWRDVEDDLWQQVTSPDVELAYRAAMVLAGHVEQGDARIIDALAGLYQREKELDDTWQRLPLLRELARHGDVPAQGILRAVLKSADPARRVEAAVALAKLGERDGLEVLRAALADTASPYRVRAGYGLVLLGDHDGHALFTRLLQGSDSPAERRLCALALKKIGDDSDLAELASRLENESDARTRIAVAVAILFVMGIDPAVLVQDNIDLVDSALDSDDVAAREAGAAVLGYLPIAEALPRLERAVSDPEPDVRLQALAGAARLEPGRAAERTEQHRQAARTVERALEREKDPRVAEQAVKTLAAIGDSAQVATLDRVSEEGGRVGVFADGARIALGVTRAVEKLALHFRTGDRGLRLAVMEAAVIAKNAIVIPTLARGLEDAARAVRLSAAEGLSQYAGDRSERFAEARKSAIVVLEGAVEASDARASGQAARPEPSTSGSQPGRAARAHAALHRLGAGRTGATEIAAMLASPDVEVRRAVPDLLAAMPWRQARPLLQRSMLDLDAEVRRQAIAAIDSFAAVHPDATKPLYKAMLEDADAIARSRARAGLASVLKPEPPVEPAGPDTALEEAREEVREASRSFDELLAAAEELAGRIDAAIAKDASEVESISEVKERERELVGLGDEAESARDGLLRAAENLSELASQPPGLADQPEVAAWLAEARRLVSDSQDSLRALAGRIRTTSRGATRWVTANHADTRLYCQTAETAIPAGRLRAAKRAIRAAERRFEQLGMEDPCVHFTWALYHDARASDAESDDERVRSLKKARRYYRRFVKSGGKGARMEQARDRLTELPDEIAGTGDPP